MPGPDATPSTVIAGAALVVITVFGAIDPRQIDPAFVRLEGAALFLAAPLSTATAFWVVRGRLPRSLRPGTGSRPLLFFWAWTLWAATSGLAGGNALTSLLLAAAYGSMVLVVSALLDRGAMEQHLILPLVLVCSGALFVCVSIMGGIFGTGLRAPNGRFDLLAFESNQLARYMGISALSSGWLAHLSHRQWRNRRGSRSWQQTLQALSRVGVAVGLGAMVVLVLSGSRTAVAAFAVATVALVFGLRGRAALIGSLGLGALALGAMAALNKVDGVLRVVSRGQTDDLTSATGRTDVWPAFASQAVEQPVLGHGLGSMSEVGLRATADGELDFVAEHAHNMALQVTVSTGLPGAILLGLAILFTVRPLASSDVDELGRFRRVGNAWALAILVFVVVDGLTEGVLLTPSFAWLGLLAAATAATAEEQLSAEEDRSAEFLGVARRDPSSF